MNNAFMVSSWYDYRAFYYLEAQKVQIECTECSVNNYCFGISFAYFCQCIYKGDGISENGWCMDKECGETCLANYVIVHNSLNNNMDHIGIQVYQDIAGQF